MVGLVADEFGRRTHIPRVIGTGRSDFANQMNNALVFPGLFRGVLDMQAQRITEGMALAAVGALVDRAGALGLSDDCLLPRLDDIESAAGVAAAVAAAATREGTARTSLMPEQVRSNTVARISSARAAAALIVPDFAE